MAITITAPTTSTGWLPTGNPIVFTINDSDPSAVYDVKVYITNPNWTLAASLRLQPAATTEVDVAPIIRDYFEDNFVADISQPQAVPNDEWASTYIIVNGSVTSSQIFVLNATASFEEAKDLPNFFRKMFPYYDPFDPAMSDRGSFAAPRLQTNIDSNAALTREQMMSAYEWPGFNPVLLAPITDGTAFGARYIYRTTYTYDASGAFKRSNSTEDMPSGGIVCNMPAVALASGYSMVKGYYYATYVSKSTAPKRSKAVVFHVPDCNHDMYSIIYKSRFGGWWYIPTHMFHYRTINVATTTMELARQSVSAHMRNRKAVSVKSQGQWTLNTDWIDRQERIVEIEDMLTSPSLYIAKVSGGEVTYIPVTMSDNSYNMADRKQDRLVQYTFTLNESFDTRR